MQQVFKADPFVHGAFIHSLETTSIARDPSPAGSFMEVRCSPHLTHKQPAVSPVSVFAPTGGPLGQDLRTHRRNKLYILIALEFFSAG